MEITVCSGTIMQSKCTELSMGIQSDYHITSNGFCLLDVDDWCNERPGDFPNSLIQLPTAPVGLTTKVPTSGARDPSNKVRFTSIFF